MKKKTTSKKTAKATSKKVAKKTTKTAKKKAFALRAYQAKHKRLILKALNSGYHCLYKSPTGAGKSTVITEVIKALSKGDWNGAIVVVPMIQIRDSFTKGRGTPKGLYEGETYEKRLSQKAREFEAWIRKPWWEREFAFVLCRQTFERVSLPRDLTGIALFVDEAHGSTQEVDKDTPILSTKRKQVRDRGGVECLVSATPFRGDALTVYDSSYVQVRRSIAEHSLPDVDGKVYAPENFEIRAMSIRGLRVRTQEEMHGDIAPRTITDEFINGVLKQWKQDGYPKAVFILSSGDSVPVSHRFLKVMKKHKVPYRGGTKAQVHNAVGNGLEIQGNFRQTLENERAAMTSAGGDGEGDESKVDINDSQVDAFLACNRFDLGTDWEVCSHVYVIGFPRSIAQTLQRWGRSFRRKTHIEGHLHPNTANITFFIPEFTKSLKEVLKFDRDHRRMALLLAGHLEDHKAGQMLVNVLRGVWDLNKPVASSNLDLEAMEDNLKLTDEELQKVNEARMYLRPDNSGQLSLAAVNQVAEAFNLTEREQMIFRMRIAASLEEGSTMQTEMFDLLHKAWKKLKRAQSKGQGRKKGRNLDTVAMLPACFNGLFDKYVMQEHEGLIRFDPPMTKKHYKMMAQCTGMDSQSIDRSMQKVVSMAHDLERIDEGIRKYCEEHGDAPGETDEDAEPYVGYKTTWAAVGRFLRKTKPYLEAV